MIGKELDFGNFSCMTKANLNKIVKINNLQTHYSASILRSNISFKKIDCEKGYRIEGNSKLNFYALMSLIIFCSRSYVFMIVFVRFNSDKIF